MKKYCCLPLAVAAWVSGAAAQDLTVSGFVEFEAAYGDYYDFERMWNPAAGVGQPPFFEQDSQVRNLDFGVDARLNFDYAQATKSGLEYGAHLELDFYKSDRSYTVPTALPGALGGLDPRVIAYARTLEMSDYLGPDELAFNDGYVFINSSLGNIKLGDTGTAGEATNQLNTPFLAPGALELTDYAPLELEQVFYANSFLGVDFEASVDDDSNWALGLGPWLWRRCWWRSRCAWAVGRRRGAGGFDFSNGRWPDCRHELCHGRNWPYPRIYCCWREL